MRLKSRITATASRKIAEKRLPIVKKQEYKKQMTEIYNKIKVAAEKGECSTSFLWMPRADIKIEKVICDLKEDGYIIELRDNLFGGIIDISWK